MDDCLSLIDALGARSGAGSSGTATCACANTGAGTAEEAACGAATATAAAPDPVEDVAPDVERSSPFQSSDMCSFDKAMADELAAFVDSYPVQILQEHPELLTIAARKGHPVPEAAGVGDDGPSLTPEQANACLAAICDANMENLLRRTLLHFPTCSVRAVLDICMDQLPLLSDMEQSAVSLHMSQGMAFLGDYDSDTPSDVEFSVWRGDVKTTAIVDIETKIRLRSDVTTDSRLWDMLSIQYFYSDDYRDSILPFDRLFQNLKACWKDEALKWANLVNL